MSTNIVSQTTKLDVSRKFTGNHLGIRFLISQHGEGSEYRPEGTWCYYLLISENQLPDEYKEDFILKPVFDDKGRLSHNYMSAAIADLNWHCGITYYSKEGGADGEPVVIKIGCDYGHYWDENHSYDEEFVLSDVKGSINSLFSMYPDIKIYSSFYGGYFKRSEGEFNKYGNFVSFLEKEKWDKEHPKAEIEA